jgi:hypothetical protein
VYRIVTVLAHIFSSHFLLKTRHLVDLWLYIEMAFVGAGFFIAIADFLVDVPFDPFLPWMFMGEEIALSIRAWTHGWNIYAPRKNLIGHQYRPVCSICYGTTIFVFRVCPSLCIQCNQPY